MSADLIDCAVYLYGRGLTPREIAEALRVGTEAVELALRLWCIDYQRGQAATAEEQEDEQRTSR